MTTHRAIVNALLGAAANREPTVLATVMRVTGSSYGGVGARMVVRVDRSTVGVVSGGCLESDIAEHAQQVHESGAAKVVTYDTRADQDAAWGLGLGCNGLVDVLLEPLTHDSARRYASILETALTADGPSVIATVIKTVAGVSAHVGAHALFLTTAASLRQPPVELQGALGDWGEDEPVNGDPRTTSSLLLQRAQTDAVEALATGRRGLVRDYGMAEIAFEVVTPAVRLVICGSGPDAVPVAVLGTHLGWDVTVVDHRPVVHAGAERFPGARVLECADPSQIAELVMITAHTAAVVMSHNFARDVEYVRALGDTRVGYLGVLGPRARTERMLTDLEEQHGADANIRKRVFGPVGLDVGGDGPEAIALSVVAEASAVISGGSGGHLRDRNAPLHGLPRQRADDAIGGTRVAVTDSA